MSPKLGESQSTIPPNELAAMRAQAYPTVLDDDGRPWWQNALARKDNEIERLRDALRTIGGRPIAPTPDQIERIIANGE